MQEHEVDSDGYRIIKPEHCAESATIEKAIIAAGYLTLKKEIIVEKLNLALELRKPYELREKAMGWWSQ